MRILRYISKGAAIMLTALAAGACQGKAQTVESDAPTFEYRGLYTPSNTEEVREAMHTNHPDYDWGLWGHNLGKVIRDRMTDDMFAVIGGKRDSSQLCFSSQKLYDCLCAYITDHFGQGTDDYGERITVMPMDNKTACTCEACRKKGNTEGNSTPAVSDFITRLAHQFPHHRFFTSAYHTTAKAPEASLPENVGVFISSITLPMRVDFKATAGYRQFVATVKAWKEKCDKIYVWDYERNYDDYLSPFPCLLAMQSRFRLYRDLGVSGLFVNGSGDDFSAFDDMQTHVMALLLDNPDMDVRKAVEEFFTTHYPQTAELLTEYYWRLEKRAKATNRLLPLYGTMKEMAAAYLNPREFVAFRSKLDAMSKQTEGDERKRLNALLTALAYTQLELYRTSLLPKDSEMAYEMREILRGHSELKGMTNISESGHTIDDYLKKWK